MGNCYKNSYKIENISVGNFIDEISFIELVKYKFKNINHDNKNFLLELYNFLNSGKYKLNIIIINNIRSEFIELKLFNLEKNFENKVRLCSVYFTKSLISTNSNKLIN
jgi:hypothetical protein